MGMMVLDTLHWSEIPNWKTHDYNKNRGADQVPGGVCAYHTLEKDKGSQQHRPGTRYQESSRARTVPLHHLQGAAKIHWPAMAEKARIPSVARKRHQ
jgi:hypothetical protein